MLLRHMLSRTVLGLLALLISFAALFITLWIVVPAPNRWLWMVSLGASEWSLWFGLAGVIGASLGAVVLRRGGAIIGWLSILLGIGAVVLALIPAVQAWRVASRERVSLSVGRHFLGAPAVGPVEERPGIVYAEVAGRPLALDVYRPAAGAAALPALIVIHGGGWNAGARGEFRAQSRALAADGLVVFDVDYRLAGPEARFPAQVADVKCAIGWVKRNATTYGVDPARIGLLGRSAGGQLALLAAYTPGQPALAPSCPADDTGVQAVVSFYAPVDLAWGYAHPPRPDFYDGPEHLRTYLGGPPEQLAEAYELASPNYQVTPSGPPALILHGGHDQIVRSEQAAFMEGALREAGVPQRTVILPWAGHGFDFARNGWGSQISEPLVREFLGEHLGM